MSTATISSAWSNVINPKSIFCSYFIAALLQQNPLDRLGTAGSVDVKEHFYFHGVDWNSVLRMKADFIPQLEDEEDTSYFDMRSERYNHEVEELDETRSSAEDTDDTQSLFASFTSGKFYSLLLIFTDFYSLLFNFTQLLIYSFSKISKSSWFLI